MPVSHTIFSLIRKDYETGGRKRPKKTNIPERQSPLRASTRFHSFDESCAWRSGSFGSCASVILGFLPTFGSVQRASWKKTHKENRRGNDPKDDSRGALALREVPLALWRIRKDKRKDKDLILQRDGTSITSGVSM